MQFKLFLSFLYFSSIAVQDQDEMEVVKSPKQKVHSNSSEAGTPKTPKSAKFEGNKFFGPNFSIEGLLNYIFYSINYYLASITNVTILYKIIGFVCFYKTLHFKVFFKTFQTSELLFADNNFFECLQACKSSVFQQASTFL